MKTYFYDRTAYRLSEQAVPSCFIRVDEVFDARFATFEEADAHPCVAMAESLCARMADVEMYAFLMEDARRRHSVDAKGDDKTSILTRSFLVGYFGAGRALLDVAAGTLASLYHLPMGMAEANFGNGDFWHQLVSNAPNVHRRYHALRLFVTEFWRWSSETAHRIPPLGSAQHHFGRYAPANSGCRYWTSRSDLPILWPFHTQHAGWIHCACTIAGNRSSSHYVTKYALTWKKGWEPSAGSEHAGVIGQLRRRNPVVPILARRRKCLHAADSCR